MLATQLGPISLEVLLIRMISRLLRDICRISVTVVWLSGIFLGVGRSVIRDFTRTALLKRETRRQRANHF
jgi:hypothetical protein